MGAGMRINRPLSHLRRIFDGDNAGRPGDGLPKTLGYTVQPTIDALGCHKLRDTQWIFAEGLAGATALVFQKEVAFLQHVFRVFTFAGFHDDGTARRLYIELLAPDSADIPLRDTSATSAAADRITLPRDVFLPPGDWRLRLRADALGASAKLYLRMTWVAYTLGEYVCL
jgi:hypothetical protein